MARAATPQDAERALEILEDTGCYIKQAAQEIGCDYSSLAALLKTDPFSARAKSAQEAGAAAMELKAEQSLLGIADNATQAAVARQRELASHYRWSAKVRNPKRYGDKVQAEVSGSEDSPLRVLIGQIAGRSAIDPSK